MKRVNSILIPKSTKIRMRIEIGIFLLTILAITSCKEEDCEDTFGRKLEVSIFNSTNVNVTQNYEPDSVIIVGQCNTGGLNGAYGRPQKHLDSLIEFSLGYCCLSDSSKYIIWLNDRQNQNIKDSFLIKLDNVNECSRCSINESKSLTNQTNFEDDGSVIRIKVFE